MHQYSRTKLRTPSASKVSFDNPFELLFYEAKPLILLVSALILLSLNPDLIVAKWSSFLLIITGVLTIHLRRQYRQRRRTLERIRRH